jgi:hypothetical protein
MLGSMDSQRLRRWNPDNLSATGGRWPGVTTSTRCGLPAGAWAVLGPARLHHTLATGEVTSKTGAGGNAAQQFPA